MQEIETCHSRIAVLVRHLVPSQLENSKFIFMRDTSATVLPSKDDAKDNIQFLLRAAKEIPPPLQKNVKELLQTQDPQQQMKKSIITYLNSHSINPSDTTSLSETLQAGVLLVASPRADVRKKFINQICEAAVKKNALVYAIAPSGSVNVTTEGVYKLSTHPTLSRRAILNAMLRHGAHLLVFGTISTRDDVMALMDATYTGYHCVAEIYAENANDALSRLEAIGVDTSMLPQNLRIVVPQGKL